MNKEPKKDSYLKNDKFFFENGPKVNVMNANQHGKSGLHGHAFYELVFVEQGYTLHFCSGVTTILTTGDAFVIVPEQEHNYINANHTKIYNCLIHKELMDSLKDDLISLPGLSRLYESEPIPPFESIHCDTAAKAELVSLLEKLKSEIKNLSEGFNIKIKALITEIFVTYSRVYNKNARSDKDGGANVKQIMTAIEFIESNYDRDILLDEIAEASGLSSSHLTRQFKQSIGLTPIEYSRSFRIAKAAELLRDKELSVSDVSKTIGFSDISLFSRQFRQITGMSATEFRKLI